LNRWFRMQAEGGWREVIGGSIGATTARFEGGTAFTLDPEQPEGGWYAQLRAAGGGSIFELGGEIGAERRNGNTALSMRGTVRVGFSRSGGWSGCRRLAVYAPHGCRGRVRDRHAGGGGHLD